MLLVSETLSYPAHPTEGVHLLAPDSPVGRIHRRHRFRHRQLPQWPAESEAPVLVEVRRRRRKRLPTLSWLLDDAETRYTFS